MQTRTVHNLPGYADPEEALHVSESVTTGAAARELSDGTYAARADDTIGPLGLRRSWGFVPGARTGERMLVELDHDGGAAYCWRIIVREEVDPS